MKYFYIIFSLLFILMFDLWVENSDQAEQFYQLWLEPIIDERKISIIWFLLGLVVAIILFRFWSNKKEEEISNLKTKLESEMEILIQANKDLSNYRLKDNLALLINQFVKKNPYVIAVQLYQIIEQNLNCETTFKVSFLSGNVVESVNINAVNQLYYKIESKYIRNFRSAKKILKEDEDPNELLDFVLDIFSILSRKSKSSLTEEDACLCSLMILGLEILERDYQLGIESLGSVDDEEKFDLLLNDYRTGLLRGALTNDHFYTFTHTKENQKLNRQYMTRLVKVRNEETMFLLALDSSILDDENYDRIMNNIGDDFESLLKDLENIYNKSIERVGD